jgi:hypothetical protein
VSRRSSNYSTNGSNPGGQAGLALLLSGGIRNELRDRLVEAPHDHLVTGLDLLHELREARLGLVDVDDGLHRLASMTTADTAPS